MATEDNVATGDALRALLLQTLENEPGRVRAAQRHEFEMLATPPVTTVIVFGAGRIGRITAGLLKKSDALQVYFCDNRLGPLGGEIDGIPMLSPQDAFARFGATAVFVACVLTASPLINQLRDAGCSKVVSVAALYRGLPEILPPYFCLDHPDAIFAERDDVLAAFDLWADDESREEYVNLVRWHVRDRYETLPRLHMSDETYFPRDIMPADCISRFVDCGAYDGDILKILIAGHSDDIDRIAAFEPDPRNLEKLETYLTSLTADLRSRIFVEPYAVSSTYATVWFSTEGDASAMNAEGDLAVECVPLDEHLADFEPTFIKMDIEGAEPLALNGAARLLRNHEPFLAISVYHKLEHLWQIPLLIRSINPGYRLYFRRYAEDCWETVCYAVAKTD